MTEMPESSESSETAGQDAQGEESEKSAPAFEPYLPSEAPQERSRKPLVFLILAVILVIGGLLFWNVEPDEAGGKKPRPDFKKMTAEQLAEDASSSAAVELVRRMFHGTPAEHKAASSVMSRPRSPRLSRNLAMAMALEQQKRAGEMGLRMERDTRMAEEGY